MKLHIKTIILSSILGSILFSCSKDFFDPKTDAYLTEERKEELKQESPEAVLLLVQGSLNGIYNNMITSRGGHDTFGLKAVHLALDVTGLDVVQTRNHWFGYDYDFVNREAPYRRTNSMWDLFYKNISSVNILLNDFYSEPLDIEDAELKLEIDQKKAEAIGLRGISYYYLVNIYQHTYKGHENALGVPLNLTTLDENMPRESVQKVYEQIIKDLTYAVENNVVTSDKKDADKAVAASYLAKTYAAMEDWINVEKYAKIAVESAKLTESLVIESGKWDISSPSWLWGYDITGETSGLYASFYSHMDSTIGGYAGALGVYKSIYNNLYDKISDTDIRKKIFINKDLFPEIAAKYKVLPKYANIKYITSSDFVGDYCYLRVEDPYLLLVEALVEQNKLIEAKTTLETLMKQRDPSYSTVGFMTQGQLRDEVRTQRRIELWGEGTAFFDLKRWNMGIDRTINGSNHRTKITVPAGDKRWIYQIPQSEIDSNPNLGEQNP